MKHGFSYAFVQKAETPKKHELYIYDDITTLPHINWETWSIEESETSAQHFRQVLESIPDEDEIVIYINSAGGEAYEGMAIANQLKRKPHVTGIVDGMCHSSAFTVLQGCGKRIMNQGTSAIIHNMWTICQGNAAQLRACADRLESAMDSCRKMYLERANISEEKLIELLDAETALTPETALEYGFIDEIGLPPTPTETPAETALNEAVTAPEPQMNKGDTTTQKSGFNRLFS